ncbi:alpha/beta fold hydrolase [Gilvimarinus sp. F26214L]|uniref:alpha/beta fold hydrolase n=1 Tax=Gilvimarinus sp. DZF01 TaxID=3461371 RepID=UPI0040463E1D
MGKKQSVFKSAAAAESVERKNRELLRHWPVEKEERQVETRHGTTQVIISGSPENPPLLLLHPACATSVYWLRQVQTYMKSHRVYAIDIVGEAGGSEPTRLPAKGPAYVEWMEDLLAQLKLDRVSVAGASLGAWIGLKFACAQPERVDRLALISPPGLVPARRSASIVVSFLSLLLGPIGRRMIFRSQLKKSDMDPHLAELIALVQRSTKRRSLQLPRFSDKELGQLYCPLFLLVGAKDAWFDAEAQVLRMVKAVPQLEVSYRPRDGHYLSEFARELDRFLVSNYAPD